MKTSLTRVPFRAVLRPAGIGALAALFIAARLTAADAPKPSAPATSTNASAASDSAKPLFDGKTLRGWKVTDFAGHGEVNVVPDLKVGKGPASPAIVCEMGAVLTGITWTNSPPQGNYEVSLEAAKLDGSDFFCALTFPAGDGHCSFVVGGWGGGVVGISSVDGMDASENETTKFMSFEKDRWYKIRVKVTESKLEAWIDAERVVNLALKDRRITVRAGEIELAEPFGLSAFQTRAAYRNIQLRSL